MRKFILITVIILFISSAFQKPVYALTQQEVDKYVWQKQVVTNIAPQADPLRQELSQKIQAMINAGHLAPYRYNVNENFVIYFWYHAGEPVYTLAEAYKYLPDGDPVKQSLRAYLTQEITSYPPYVGTQVYNKAPWLPLQTGARREYHPLQTIPTTPNNLNQSHPIIQTFYHLWDYVDATGDTTLVSSKWSQIIGLFDTLKNRGSVGWMDDGGCVTKYGDIAGCIGMARLAYIVNNQNYIDQASSRALTGFNSGLDFNQFDTNSYNQARYFTEEGGDDSRDPTSSQLRSYVYLNLFPETARFIKDNSVAAAQTHIDKITQNIPTWYITNSPAFVGGETNRITPLTSYPVFQAYAQIFRKDYNFLKNRLDVPLAKVGDLYYLQNLVSTIKAYGQTCWVYIRTSQQISCEAAPSVSPLPSTIPSPSPFATGDFDQSGQVNEVDAELLISNWLLSTCTTFSCDTNQDSKNNSLDFAWTFKEWGN